MSVSNETLGLAIRHLREQMEPRLTQQALGVAAGYKAGAAVSLSRIESGQSRPAPERLARIAAALGVTVTELHKVGADLEGRLADMSGGDTAQSKQSPGAELTLKERIVRVEQVVVERTRTATAAADAFNSAVDRARLDFFEPFRDTGLAIEGAPAVEEPAAIEVVDGEDEAVAEARFRLRHSSAVAAGTLGGAGAGAAGAVVGGASAYATFTAAAAFGSASTGTAIGGLNGAAATNATLAFLGGGSLATGGAGVAGGTMLLTGIVAAPVAALAAGGVFYMVRRNRKKQEEVEEKLRPIEDEVVASKPGFEAMVRLLEDATETLNHIATFASRAHQLWAGRLPTSPTRWEDMSEAQRERYVELIDVAGAQLLISTVSMSFTLLMSARGADLASLITSCEEQLAEARRAVEAAV